MDEPSAPSTDSAAAGAHISAGRDVHIAGDVAGRDLIRNYYNIVITPGPAEDEHAPPEPGDPPYKGLQYFEESDADRFFGREALTAKLAARLNDASFLAVIGASGSGKSSLVRAGLIPALRRGERLADRSLPPAASGQWDIRTFTPGSHPLEALAAVLTRDEASVAALTALQQDLRQEPRTLSLAAQQLLARNGKRRLMVFIDQFEEVFTLCRQPGEREAFINQLLAATETATGPVVVVIALRADFYAQCAQHAGLRERISRQQEYIGAMSRAELASAILEPARRGGWTIQEGLVELMLDEVGDEPGALPLLSHALHETWRRRRGRKLTLSGYREAGGVQGAIAQTAEAVFQQRLTPAQRPIARIIFLQLTELGATSESPDTRRRVPFSELITRATDAAMLEAVLHILAEARLVTVAQEDVEVAHEALIREWPTLRGWLDENRKGLLRQRALTEDAAEWERLGRDAGALYRGARLRQMLEWAERFPEPISAREADFLQASRLNAEREAAEARQLQQARWRQRVLLAITGLAVVAVLATIAVARLNAPPATPQKMTGAFNIAVAQFAGPAQDGALLSRWVYERLTAEFQADPNVQVWHDSATLQREQNVVIGVAGDGPGAEAPAAMAERLNADVIVYGVIMPGANNFSQAQLRFYVAPQLDRDLSSVAGNYAFGAPLTFAAGNPGLEVQSALGDQAGAVAQLSLGLTYELLSRSADALRAFEKAATYLPDSEIVHFLLGQEYLFIAQKQADDAALQMEAIEPNVAAARAAFAESARLNPDYARARIGLGSVETFLVQLRLIEQPVPDDCAGSAAETYRPLLLPLQTAAESYAAVTRQGLDPQAYGLPLDSVAQLGLGQVQQLRAVVHCGLGDPAQARRLTQLAITLIQATVPALNEAGDYRLLAQTYQTLGVAYEYEGYLGGGVEAYRQAISAYEQCIAQGDRLPVDTFLRDEIIARLCVPSRDQLVMFHGDNP